MRYVMRIAESSESSNFWTHLALPGNREHVCWSACSQPQLFSFFETSVSILCCVFISQHRIMRWQVERNEGDSFSVFLPYLSIHLLAIYLGWSVVGVLQYHVVKHIKNHPTHHNHTYISSCAWWHKIQAEGHFKRRIGALLSIHSGLQSGKKTRWI